MSGLRDKIYIKENEKCSYIYYIAYQNMYIPVPYFKISQSLNEKRDGKAVITFLHSA